MNLDFVPLEVFEAAGLKLTYDVPLTTFSFFIEAIDDEAEVGGGAGGVTSLHSRINLNTFWNIWLLIYFKKRAIILISCIDFTFSNKDNFYSFNYWYSIKVQWHT